MHIGVCFVTVLVWGGQRGGVFSSTQPLPSQRQWSKRSFPGRVWMERAGWPCRWQVNAHAVSNVSSPSSLWLETSWRALSDKCISHRKPASCILDGFWLWQQMLQICGVSFILGFTFANSAVFLNSTLLHGPNKYADCLFPFSVPPWAQENRGYLNVVLPRSLWSCLHDRAHSSQNHSPGLLPCPSLSSLAVFAFTLVVFWWFFYLHAKGAAGKGFFFSFFFFFLLWVGESSILHNLSPFSVSLYQIAILGSPGDM